MAETKVKAPVKEKKIRKESNTVAIFKRLMRNKPAMIGLCIFIILGTLAILSPIINPYDYTRMDLKHKSEPPSVEHLLGTDDLGRDLLSRLLYGGRYSLTMGMIAVLAACVVGVVIGAIAGFFGGMVDNLIMRFLEIFQAVPGMLMTIAISTALGTGVDKTILALAISRIPNFARVLRASVLRVRTLEYVEAAEAIGCSSMRRIFKYVVPNSIAPVIVQVTMGMANSVLTLASLSYVGLGVQPPTPEWGAMLSGARPYLRDYPYMLIMPGIFIGLTVLSLNLLGDGLRDALDPRLKD